jgi:hypothetical protein
MSRKGPWVHRFHRFTQIKCQLTGLFWAGRFASMGVRGGAGIALLGARHRRPHGTSGGAGGRLRRAHARWVGAHLCNLWFQFLILKSDG